MPNEHGKDFTRPFQMNNEQFDCLLGVLQDIANSVSALANVVGNVAAVHPPPNGDTTDDPLNKETKAVAALAVMGPNVSAIARELGVSRMWLYRCEAFMMAYRLYQADAESRRRSRPRGSKAENGDMESWD